MQREPDIIGLSVTKIIEGSSLVPVLQKNYLNSVVLQASYNSRNITMQLN